MTGGLRWGIEPICTTLEIAPSTYYSAKTRPDSARAVSDAELKPTILAVFEGNYSVYGARKMWKALARQDVIVGRDRVGQLMRVLGLAGATRAKKRSRQTERNITRRARRKPRGRWLRPASLGPGR